VSRLAPLPWEAKVDARLRRLLARARCHPDESRQVVDVFVRFAGSADSLRAHGVKVRAVAGDIATASIELENVPRVASVGEVVFMELSKSWG
jgi:hypothetical protein